MTTLTLLYKPPSLGFGKQRLAETIGKESAFVISQSLLDCALDDLKSWPEEKVLSPAIQTKKDTSSKYIPSVHILPQQSGNLGERINHLDKTIRKEKSEEENKKILLIGSDSPLLTQQHYQQASEVLGNHDVVLIPASDGGVVLMGSRKPWPDLRNLPWSTPQLKTALIQACEKNNLSVYLLNEEQDIDTQEDLKNITPKLKQDKRSTRIHLYQAIEKINRLKNNSPVKPSVSIVIPCYQDEVHLKNLLHQIQNLSEAPHEIIVIDGAKNTGCKKLCASFNAAYLESEACRGRQLRLGAEQATGDVIWFLHCDATIEPSALSRIIRSIQQDTQQGSIGGYFSFYFEQQSFPSSKPWQAKLIEILTQWRNRQRGLSFKGLFKPLFQGMIYGDQGLFVQRDVYWLCGGHSPESLFEEVPLLKALYQYQRQANKPFTELSTGLTVNPQRWLRDGWWKRSLRNRKLAILYSLGFSTQTLSALYLEISE